MAASSEDQAKLDDNPENPMLPIYKQLSLKNGEINKMTKDQLKRKLGELRLDNRGVKEVLKKRLKNFYRKRELMRAKIKGPGNQGEKYDYLAVIDFEATCQENNAMNYKHEIIEFPIVLVDTAQRKIVGEFQSYVKPVLNPQLTTFCTVLTGITQETVDTSDNFPVVLKRAEEWMESHNLGKCGRKFAVLTDGPWDMARFLHMQCLISALPFPKWARKWVNIRKAFSNFYGFPRRKLSMMLDSVGMVFEGNQHSGIDDARNIARIAIRMLEDGCDIQKNERISRGKLREHTLSLPDIEHIKRKDRSSNAADSTSSSTDEGDDTGPTDARDLKSSEKNCQDTMIKKTTLCMKTLTLNEHQNDIDSQSESDYEDLLAYYALQKS